MYKNLNTTADIEEYKIKNNLADLVMKIKNNSTNNTKKIRNRNNMLEIVKLILKFNQPEQGSGLKILTPNQMLSRLQISLAQLKAGNNSEKLRNEIQQILYFYRSKKVTKNVYKSMVDII